MKARKERNRGRDEEPCVRWELRDEPRKCREWLRDRKDWPKEGKEGPMKKNFCDHEDQKHRPYCWDSLFLYVQTFNTTLWWYPKAKRRDKIQDLSYIFTYTSSTVKLTEFRNRTLYSAPALTNQRAAYIFHYQSESKIWRWVHCLIPASWEI